MEDGGRGRVGGRGSGGMGPWEGRGNENAGCEASGGRMPLRMEPWRWMGLPWGGWGDGGWGLAGKRAGAKVPRLISRT